MNEHTNETNINLASNAKLEPTSYCEEHEDAEVTEMQQVSRVRRMSAFLSNIKTNLFLHTMNSTPTAVTPVSIPFTDDAISRVRRQSAPENIRPCRSEPQVLEEKRGISIKNTLTEFYKNYKRELGSGKTLVPITVAWKQHGEEKPKPVDESEHTMNRWNKGISSFKMNFKEAFLSPPSTVGLDPSNNNKPKIDSAQVYGVGSSIGRRPYMEDAYCAILNLCDYAKAMGAGHDLGSLSNLLNHRVYPESPKYFTSIRIGSNTPDSSCLEAISSCDVLRGKAISLYGVFDGHAGSRCSTSISRWLGLHLLHHIRQSENFEKAIEDSHFDMDGRFLIEADKNGYRDGSTAVCIYIQENDLYTSNVGDSRAVLVQEDKTMPLTVDQKPNNQIEKERIEKCGGTVLNIRGVYRVNGLLAVARAFGDSPLKRYISCQPVITKHSISENDLFVVLASDGLWDVLSNEEVGRIVRDSKHTKTLTQISESLVNLALERGSMDNITAVIVNLPCVRAMQNKNNGVTS